MDLKSGNPYFFLKNGLYQDFEILNANHETEIVILGGGISGALMAYQLNKKGITCTIVDKRKIGLGSTSASTSMLQYEIDVSLHELSKQIGRENAVLAYKKCEASIDALYEIAKEIGYKDFTYCESLYFSDTRRKSTYLKEEFESRKEAGFGVHFLEENELKKRYEIQSKEAILSEKAARMDGYLFTQLLHTHNVKRGVQVFENVCVTKISESESGIELLMEGGHVIKAKKIVYASGYEVTEQISKSIVSLKSTYAIVTERIQNLPSFFEKTLFWNTADPYLYFRADNGRLIIGGRDENNYNPIKRALLLEKKAEKLKEDFEKICPGITLKSQFSWAGTFGSTKDGLPYIGTYSKKPNSYFALGFGGNGITFSVIAAEMIALLIKDEINVIPKIFSFDR